VHIGNNLEETAYHEAGHIVVAAVLGLDLRPKGITIWEVEPDVMDGLARYWESETDWEGNLQSIRAGGLAQWRKFPQAYIGGQKCDIANFNKIVAEHFAGAVASNMWQSEGEKADALLQAHWRAVVEIAETLIAAEWIPVEENEHLLAKRKKNLDGEALVSILSSHGIRARVRLV
jgi:ATP-dependent Zn protease